MSHTCGFRYSAGFVQRPVTTVSIGLKHSAVTGQMILWMDAFLVRAVRKPDRRRYFRTGVTVITDVDPLPGSPCFTAARLLDRNGDIIGMDFTGISTYWRRMSYSGSCSSATTPVQRPGVATVYF